LRTNHCSDDSCCFGPGYLSAVYESLYTYTFHSFRRTSATSAADGGSTAAQMTDFFGWKNPSMCHEYVSSSKPAITKMAQTLAAYPENFSMDEPDVEMEVEVEVAEVPEDSEKNAKEELSEEFMFAMEEDPEMYVAAVVVSGNSNTTMNF
jgi:hypothetical protein